MSGEECVMQRTVCWICCVIHERDGAVYPQEDVRQASTQSSAFLAHEANSVYRRQGGRMNEASKTVK